IGIFRSQIGITCPDIVIVPDIEERIQIPESGPEDPLGISSLERDLVGYLVRSMKGWKKIGIVLGIVFTGIGQQSAEIGIFQPQTEFEPPFIPFIPPGSIGSQYLLVVFKKVGQGWFLDPFIILERRNGIIIPYVVDQILTTGFNRKNIGNRIGIIQFESIISLLKIGGGS